MGSGGFVLTNQDLADILGRTDLDFEDFYDFAFLDHKFPNFQVPDFQISRNLAGTGLGQVHPLPECVGGPLGWAGAPQRSPRLVPRVGPHKGAPAARTICLHVGGPSYKNDAFPASRNIVDGKYF